MTRPRVLVLGFHVPGTGFTRVLRSMLAPLASRYDIHYLGLAYKGPVIEDGITIYPSNLRGGDAWGVERAIELIESLRPRIVFVLHDLWYLREYLQMLEPYRDRLKAIVYFPLDGRIPDPVLVTPLALADRAVVYTEFARREVERAIQAVAARREDFPSLDVVAHGVDLSNFRPLDSDGEARSDAERRREIRARLFPDAHDSFVVLNANRSNPRKRIDLTVRGFAKFARRKPPGVRLHLHHAVSLDLERAEIDAWVGECGIEDRVRITPRPGAPVSSDADLNLLYNACDVGLNTSMGEGWGLIAFEHAATRAAQIVPRHSACEELWGDAAELLEPAGASVPTLLPIEQQAVTADGVAAALERLHADPAYLEAQARAAYRRAIDPAYSWTTIADQWDRLFREVL